MSVRTSFGLGGRENEKRVGGGAFAGTKRVAEHTKVPWALSRIVSKRSVHLIKGMRICPGLIEFSTSSTTFRIVEMSLADIAGQHRMRTCPYVPV